MCSSTSNDHNLAHLCLHWDCSARSDRLSWIPILHTASALQTGKEKQKMLWSRILKVFHYPIEIQARQEKSAEKERRCSCIYVVLERQWKKNDFMFQSLWLPLRFLLCKSSFTPKTLSKVPKLFYEHTRNFCDAFFKMFCFAAWIKNVLFFPERDSGKTTFLF